MMSSEFSDGGMSRRLTVGGYSDHPETPLREDATLALPTLPSSLPLMAMTLLTLVTPLTLLTLTGTLTASPAPMSGVAPSYPPFGYSRWWPHRVAAPPQFRARDQRAAPQPAARLGRLGRLASILGGLRRPAPPRELPREQAEKQACRPGDTWTSDCASCVCTPDGQARCAGDDCSFLPQPVGDDSMLDLNIGDDDMDLQALSSERHVLVLLP